MCVLIFVCVYPRGRVCLRSSVIIVYVCHASQDMDRSDELLTDVVVGGEEVPVPLFLDQQYVWPATGEFSCQFIHFPVALPISKAHYDSLLTEVCAGSCACVCK